MKMYCDLNLLLYFVLGMVLVSFKTSLLCESKRSYRKLRHGGRFLGGFGKPSSISMYEMANSVGANSISVVQLNGKTQVALNGVNIDLSKARVVEEDQHKVVLSPIEAPDAIITLGKGEQGRIAIDYKGQHYESMRPEDISNMIQGNMAQMNAQMQKLRQQMQNMQNNIMEQFKMPFMGGGFGGFGGFPMMGGLF
uniref:Heat shock protein SSA2 n=2 Tax=Lygus hesperus TaxID=30085 RepID=A0A0A9WM70_LYGHE